MKVRYIKIIRIGKNIRLLAHHAILDTDTNPGCCLSPQTILHTRTCCISLYLILDTSYLDTYSINDLHAPGNICYIVYHICYMLLVILISIIAMHAYIHVICSARVRCGILLLRSVHVQVYKLV